MIRRMIVITSHINYNIHQKCIFYYWAYLDMHLFSSHLQAKNKPTNEK